MPFPLHSLVSICWQNHWSVELKLKRLFITCPSFEPRAQGKRTERRFTVKECNKNTCTELEVKYECYLQIHTEIHKVFRKKLIYTQTSLNSSPGLTRQNPHEITSQNLLSPSLSLSRPRSGPNCPHTPRMSLPDPNAYTGWTHKPWPGPNAPQRTQTNGIVRN